MTFQEAKVNLDAWFKEREELRTELRAAREALGRDERWSGGFLQRLAKLVQP